jgi:hypothetical protein
MLGNPEFQMLMLTCEGDWSSPFRFTYRSSSHSLTSHRRMCVLLLSNGLQPCPLGALGAPMEPANGACLFDHISERTSPVLSGIGISIQYWLPVQACHKSTIPVVCCEERGARDRPIIILAVCVSRKVRRTKLGFPDWHPYIPPPATHLSRGISVFVSVQEYCTLPGGPKQVWHTYINTHQVL